MLTILRHKGVAKRIIWVIVIIIIISFGLLGTAYLVTGQNKTDYAGTIFSKKISISDFNKAYQDVTIQAIIRYGDKFNSIRQYLNLESETWDRLILANEAKKRNIKILDQDVVKAIEEYPFFQRDGQFDSLLYKDILRYVFKIDARQFEENIRETLKLSKMIDQETAQIDLSEEEIYKAFETANEKIQVSYIFIAPDKFKAQAVTTDEEEKSYYANNKNEFLLPVSIKAEYVTLNYPLTPDQKEEDITKVKETITTKAQEFYQAATAGTNLQDTAQKYNLDVKTTDYFSPEQPNPSLGWPISTYREILNLTVGQISPPLDTGAGMTIIKIIDKKDSFIPEFVQVQPKVKDAVLISKAKKIAQGSAKDLLNKIKDAIGKTSFIEFPKLAKELGADIEQTPAFTRGQYLPKLGIEREFQEAAFRLNDQHKLSDVVETQNGWAILYLDSRIAADKADFEKQKQTFANSLLSEKKMKFFSDYLTGLRLKANLVDNISKLKEQK